MIFLFMLIPWRVQGYISVAWPIGGWHIPFRNDVTSMVASNPQKREAVWKLEYSPAKWAQNILTSIWEVAERWSKFNPYIDTLYIYTVYIYMILSRNHLTFRLQLSFRCLFLNTKCIKYWKVSPVGSHSWNRLIQYFSIYPSRRSTREESAITQFARRKLYVRQYAKPQPTLQALHWRFQAASPWAGL